MNRKTALLTVSTLVLATAATVAMADPATKVEDGIWGDGVTWDVVVTDTSFKQPPAHTVDKLYNFSMSGLTGQRSVSESVPGDRDYNGGRWWVQMVVFTEQGLEVHDPNGDGVADFELTSAEEVAHHVELGHLEIHETSTYFSCPLQRSR